MDGAWIGSIDISINKAFTARAFDISTADLSENSQPGQQFYGIQNSNHGRVMIFAGGVPLRRDGMVIGAIGVSGGSGTQDQAVATAGASAAVGATAQRGRTGRFRSAPAILFSRAAACRSEPLVPADAISIVAVLLFEKLLHKVCDARQRGRLQRYECPGNISSKIGRAVILFEGGDHLRLAADRHQGMIDGRP